MAKYDYTRRGNAEGDGENRFSYRLCRPVVVDADGRKRAIVYYPPHVAGSESNAPDRTERVVDHVRAPVMAGEYKYSYSSQSHQSQARVESRKEYWTTNGKWVGAPSPDYHSSPEYGFGSPTKVEPGKGYGATTGGWIRSSGTVHDGPQVVAEHGHTSPTKVEPPKDSNLTADNRRRPSSPPQDRRPRDSPKSTRHGGSTTGYGGTESPNLDNNHRNKPNGNSNTIRDEDMTKPTVPERPGREGRQTPSPPPPPPPRNTPLSAPTNDIGKVVETLKETVKSPPTAAKVAPPPPPRSSKSAPTETIDSKEAARRYGNFDPSTRPKQTGETYTGTIDSREAARKYNGTRVPFA